MQRVAQVGVGRFEQTDNWLGKYELSNRAVLAMLGHDFIDFSIMTRERIIRNARTDRSRPSWNLLQGTAEDKLNEGMNAVEDGSFRVALSHLCCSTVEKEPLKLRKSFAFS